MAGPQGLKYQEIHFWQMGAGIRLAPWQRRALIDMDRAFRTEVAEMSKPKEEQVLGNLTPDVFDELFGEDEVDG